MTNTEKEDMLLEIAAMKKQIDHMQQTIDGSINHEKASEPPKPTREERFWQLFHLCDSIKADPKKFPNRTFGLAAGMTLWEYNAENGYLWCRYALVWKVFETEYGMEYSKIQSFIKDMVEEHFKCKRITPHTGCVPHHTQVEEHFKCKGITPGI